MNKFFASIILMLSLSACSSSNDAHRALESAGFTEISITGYRFTGCGEDDDFTTGFTARNPQGKYVSGVVCSGWFKGGTIRFD